MVDQIYYKVQYPLKKAIDLMKETDNYDLDYLKENMNSYDKEKILKFIESWNDDGKKKLHSLINDLKAHQ